MTSTCIGINEIENIDYWKTLLPDCRITRQPFSPDQAPYELLPEVQERIRDQAIQDGYFQIQPLIDPATISLLRRLVEDLDSKGIMPIFAALYDDFWINIHRLRTVLIPVLGTGYRCVPDFWVWLVPTDESKSGWPPHRDAEFSNEIIRDNGTPRLCTAWFPLTDATPDNACIYVLPRKHDLYFQDFVRKRFGKPGIPNVEKIPMDIASIRALPAQAGSILGWDPMLLHWGGRASRYAPVPRISIGIYYQAADRVPTGRPFDNKGRTHIDYETPGCQLTFNDRLAIIANNIDTYRYKLDAKQVYERHYTESIASFSEKWKF
jgi:hypothetical protein